MPENKRPLVGSSEEFFADWAAFEAPRFRALLTYLGDGTGTSLRVLSRPGKSRLDTIEEVLAELTLMAKAEARLAKKPRLTKTRRTSPRKQVL